MHSARWDHDLDLDDKRVAVVGTGASAIQFVPGIVDRVSHMTVFQRSAPWILPKGDRPYRRWERRWMDRVPGAQLLNREWIFWTNELRILAFNKQDSLLGKASELLCRLHINRQIQDHELREVVTPDYPIGCKRVLVSNDWYPALDRDHVEVETSGIGRVVEEGIITSDGRLVEADVLLFGTGFHSTEFLAPMQITGRGGRQLDRDAWADGAEAYLGITVPDFPNLFLLYGPNTNLGHNSIIFMIESQLRYVVDAIEHLRRRPRHRRGRQARGPRRLQRPGAGRDRGIGLERRLRQLVQERQRQGHQQLARGGLPVPAGHPPVRAGALPPHPSRTHPGR